MPDRYTWGDVLTNCMGITYRPRKNTKLVCPACGHKSYYANLEKGVGKCWHCDSKEVTNVCKFYAYSRGISTKEANKEILQTLGLWEERGQKVEADKTPKPMKKPLKKVPEIKSDEYELASIEVRDKTNRRLARLMGLSEKHRANLKERGHSDKYIKSLHYWSFDKTKELKVVDTLLKEGCVLEGVPLFYWSYSEKRWRIRHMPEGIFVPYYDENHKLQGFQLRRDKFDKAKKESKYLWGAGADIKSGNPIGKGTASLSYYSLALNQTNNNGDKNLYLIEGAMKAYLVQDFCNINVIAVAGVSALTEFEKLLKSGYLQSKGIKTIVNAYDMDYLTNPNVQKAMETTKLMIEENGFKYERRIWDENYKGYDDYLKHYLNR